MYRLHDLGTDLEHHQRLSHPGEVEPSTRAFHMVPSVAGTPKSRIVLAS